jgi:hypothetical protein
MATFQCSYPHCGIPNAETIKAIKEANEALADLKRGRKPKKAKVFKNWQEFLKDLET